MEDDSDKLAFCAGQVHALMQIVTTLVLRLPNRQIVVVELQSLEQAARARTESQPVHEEYLKGFEYVYQSVREVIEKSPAP
jgi:hypothetical protein